MEMTIGDFRWFISGNNHKNKVISRVEMTIKKWWFPGGGNDHPPKGGIFLFPPAVSLRGKVVVRQLTHDDSFPATQ
jgi:hypothetical protein